MVIEAFLIAISPKYACVYLGKSLKFSSVVYYIRSWAIFLKKGPSSQRCFRVQKFIPRGTNAYKRFKGLCSGMRKKAEKGVDHPLGKLYSYPPQGTTKT